MQMLDAWFEEEHDELEALLDRVGSDFGQVIRNLIVALAGTIDVIATSVSKTFEKLLLGFAHPDGRSDRVR